VLKHRKRKEKALRKLEAMQANLNRLQDLTAELRRQLKPLGRQAEVARRAGVIQADLRDARLRLLADDLREMRTALDAEVADETALLERRAQVEAELTESDRRERDLDAAVAELGGRLARAQETWYRLAGLRERLRGTAALASERQRQVGQTVDIEVAGRDPRAWQDDVNALRVDEAAVQRGLVDDRARLAATEGERVRLEQLLSAEDHALRLARQARADRREGRVRLHGEVQAMRTRAAAADDEIGRLTVAWEAAQVRSERAAAEFAAVESEIAGMDSGEVDLDTAYETAAAAHAAAQEQAATLGAEEREVERQRSAAAARRDALGLGLDRKDGSAALVAARGALPGVLGTVADLVGVRAGFETAIAAALGSAADAVAVRSLADAAAAINLLRRDDAGRAGLLVGAATGSAPEGAEPESADVGRRRGLGRRRRDRPGAGTPGIAQAARRHGRRR